MRSSPTSAELAPYIIALLGVAGVAWLTSAMLPLLGLASAALLFLLPVLYTATRGGLGPGLCAALAGAAAYNFFLLPPRLTFRIHGLDNLVSVFVLVAVALVTSRLAIRLMAREGEALERARLSEEGAELSTLLAGHPAQTALARGLDWVATRYGSLRLLDGELVPQGDAAFSSLDLSAAAWAAHNGDVTGHGSEVMPAADWTFFPLAAKNRQDGQVAALARPVDGSTRRAAELDHVQQLALLLGQCRDRDVLEAERQERELLAQSDRLLRTFLASLGHDFRTPLTIITGRLALLARDAPDARDALIAAQRMDRMMADLLGAARIEDGSLAPAMENVDLVDAIGAACDDMTLPEGVAIVRTIPADLPFVRADPVLLHHILANLIDNALHHATARVTLAAHQQLGGIALQISDDGPGVPEAERARIFARFTRLEGSDRTSGSGLGLAIVKGFADAMGMTVSVTAAPSGGACFTLVIPIGEAPPT